MKNYGNYILFAKVVGKIAYNGKGLAMKRKSKPKISV